MCGLCVVWFVLCRVCGLCCARTFVCLCGLCCLRLMCRGSCCVWFELCSYYVVVGLCDLFMMFVHDVCS